MSTAVAETCQVPKSDPIYRVHEFLLLNSTKSIDEAKSVYRDGSSQYLATIVSVNFVDNLRRIR